MAWHTISRVRVSQSDWPVTWDQVFGTDRSSFGRAGLRGFLLAIDSLNRMPAALQFVLDRILHLRKVKLNALCVQTVVELRDDVRGGDVDTRHWLSRDHDPTNGRGRTRHRA